MVKDYAPSTTDKNRQRKSNKKTLIWILATAVILLLGLWSSVLFIHHRHQAARAKANQKMLTAASPHHIKSNASLPKKNSLLQDHQKNGLQKSNKPTFDFYHLLSKIQVPVSAQNKKTDNQELAPVYEYFLQIATSSRQADAITLQKKLQKMGVQSFLMPIQLDGKKTYYRIMSGPFADIVNAQTTQDQLRLKQMNVLLIKRKAGTLNANNQQAR